MEQDHKRKKLKLYKLIVISCIGAFLCYTAIQFAHQDKVLREQMQKKIEMKEKLGQLDDEYEALKKELEDCNSMNFIERYLRDKLGMLREGEILFEPDETPAPTSG